MKKMAGGLICLLCVPIAYASDCCAPPLLDKVTFQISAKRWVSTQMATLVVGISASLGSADLIKARTGMIGQLNKIVSGDWHIIQFNRYQDSSGLEKLDVIAQVSVNQSHLTKIYDAAKTISKPGETYQVLSIEFNPDLAEIQAVKTQLRQTLNQQIQQELGQINHAYPEQHYTLSALTYADAPPPLQESKLALLATGTRRAVKPLSLSQEVEMTAMVEAGSVRK